MIAEIFLSFSDISNISNQAEFIPVVAFRAVADKEMAGSRYDSDFLSLSASWGHPSYLYHKGVCHPRHTDDSGRAHKPIFRPSRFLSSLMPHTLSLFICLHPSCKHTERAKGRKKKREKRYARQVRDLSRKCSPSENPVTGRMATEGLPPNTTHRSSVCLVRSEPERSETLPHYTINAQSGGCREAVTGCRMNPSCFAVSLIYNAADTWL